MAVKIFPYGPPIRFSQTASVRHVKIYNVSVGPREPGPEAHSLGT